MISILTGLETYYYGMEEINTIYNTGIFVCQGCRYLCTGKIEEEKKKSGLKNSWTILGYVRVLNKLL